KGTLWTWGLNLFGELGDGTYDYGTEKYVPTQIGTATDWKYIAAGAYHTLAIKTDGSLWAWGANNSGQLGDGTVGLGNDRYIPTKIGTSTWKFVAAGTYHTLGIKTDGTLWAWGINSEGQLGDGTKIERNVPTQIGTVADWQSVSTSNNHNAAIKADGTLWTWGQHSWGKLGDGTYLEPTNPTPPTQVGTSTDWKIVSAGGEHTIAVKTNGTLWAWGYNGNGEYGDGVYGFNNFTPEQIGTATNWQSVATGYAHTIFSKTDGTLWATGQNLSGQLGNGTLNGTNLPIQIGCTALGLEEVASGNIPFTLYPNPVKNVLFLRNENGQLIDKVIIADFLGKTVLEEIGNASQINIQRLQSGIYFIQIVSDGRSTVNKFIKE
ncbi:MAG: T9SS type A sorting domain-containing protein, partial [Flavobacterium sp.]